MSMLLYAIAEAGSARIGGRGLSDQPLREIADDRLAAIVTEHERPPRTLAPAHLAAYTFALERIMARGAMLPARFGSVIADAPAVRSMLADRGAELTARLAAVRGAVELAVRADRRRPPEGNYASGAAYMRARLAERRQAAEVASALQPLAGLAREVRIHDDATGDTVLRVSYLVREDRLEAFTARVAQVDASLPDVELLCSGPWPPFSFVGGPGA